MSFLGRTAAEVLVTPHDERLLDPDGTHVVTDTQVEDRLAYCFAQSRGPLAFLHYGANLPSFFDGCRALLDRELPVIGVFDWTQYNGPTEKKQQAALLASHPAPWQCQDLVTGSERGGAINHGKVMVFNAPLRGYKPTVGDYQTVEEAFAAGACVSWFGSWNATNGASKQFNYVCLMPGIAVGAMFVQAIEEARDYIIGTQQRHQPFPRIDAKAPNLAAEGSEAPGPATDTPSP